MRLGILFCLAWCFIVGRLCYRSSWRRKREKCVIVLLPINRGVNFYSVRVWVSQRGDVPRWFDCLGHHGTVWQCCFRPERQSKEGYCCHHQSSWRTVGSRWTKYRPKWVDQRIDGCDTCFSLLNTHTTVLCKCVEERQNTPWWQEYGAEVGGEGRRIGRMVSMQSI